MGRVEGKIAIFPRALHFIQTAFALKPVNSDWVRVWGLNEMNDNGLFSSANLLVLML